MSHSVGLDISMKEAVICIVTSLVRPIFPFIIHIKTQDFLNQSEEQL